MAHVELKNVSKIYDGNAKAVDSVSFEIKDKEFVVLVGPSGCGKSTTLRMVAGLEEITSGELYIDDKLVNEVPPKDRDIAMVFQNYALYPHMSVFDNMAFGLKIRKYSKEEIKNRVDEASSILGLNDLLQRKPKQLSGGQRQRVALGRAIVRKPKVFLFDEPLSNLDAKLRVQMRTEISKLHKKLEATMIYVTHDQTEAMTMGDRIVVMKDGLINQIDSPMDLYNNPTNKFVAGFIGSPAMNFIDGKIIMETGLFFLSSDKSVKIPLLKEHSEKLEKCINSEVTIGIRPENISLSKSEKDDYQITTTLDVVEPMGNETIIYFNIGDNPIIARVQSPEILNINSNYGLYLNLEKLHFFEAGTENVI
ncbi:MAG: sn-glycerol-3-phosphate ABC transporter ATP-binding protein UgpC [Bacteroidales bacterium]|jgi:multiple sugar transport system ATP-binding protein|nr:sn-glycerol-3-phosphate ABC transporter ATP-binding protein UgpC [Bacteroidales bacterium]